MPGKPLGQELVHYTVPIALVAAFEMSAVGSSLAEALLVGENKLMGELLPVGSPLAEDLLPWGSPLTEGLLPLGRPVAEELTAGMSAVSCGPVLGQLALMGCPSVVE